MKADQQRMRDVLVDTIRLLCRTGVDYSRRLRVQGLLGITVDDDHVFLIHVDDFIARNCTDTDSAACDNASDCITNNHGNIADAEAFADESVTDKYSLSSDVHRSSLQPHCADVELNHAACLPVNQSIYNNVSVSDTTSGTTGLPGDVNTAPAMSQLSQNAPSLSENISPPDVPMSCERSVSNNEQQSISCVREPPPTGLVGQPGYVGQPCSNQIYEMTPDDLNRVKKMETDVSHNKRLSGSTVNEVRDVAMHPTLTAMNATVTTMHESVPANQNAHLLPLPVLANQTSHEPSDISCFDSDGNESNEDGDSDNTSESEEMGDYSRMPPLDLISSLQVDPRALAGSMSRWPPITSVAQNTETGADTAPLQPAAVLSGVVPAAGPQTVSAYYQQQMLAAAAAAAHNRAARAAAVSIKSLAPTTTKTESGSGAPAPHTAQNKPPELYAVQRRLPRRPRESEDKRFRCPFCELAYYHKKHLKYHLTKKHGF